MRLKKAKRRGVEVPKPAVLEARAELRWTVLEACLMREELDRIEDAVAALEHAEERR